MVCGFWMTWSGINKQTNKLAGINAQDEWWLVQTVKIAPIPLFEVLFQIFCPGSIMVYEGLHSVLPCINNKKERLLDDRCEE